MSKALKSTMIAVAIVLATLVALHIFAAPMMGSLTEAIHGHR